MLQDVDRKAAVHVTVSQSCLEGFKIVYKEVNRSQRCTMQAQGGWSFVGLAQLCNNVLVTFFRKDKPETTRQVGVLAAPHSSIGRCTAWMCVVAVLHITVLQHARVSADAAAS